MDQSDRTFKFCPVKVSLLFFSQPVTAHSTSSIHPRCLASSTISGHQQPAGVRVVPAFLSADGEAEANCGSDTVTTAQNQVQVQAPS